jgi:hypothetical protein
MLLWSLAESASESRALARPSRRVWDYTAKRRQPARFAVALPAGLWVWNSAPPARRGG